MNDLQKRLVDLKQSQADELRCANPSRLFLMDLQQSIADLEFQLQWSQAGKSHEVIA